MRTVVIAEKQQIEGFQNYATFLSPLLDENQVAFCEWIPAENCIAASVSGLPDLVRAEEEWRAIILLTDRDAHKRNPFDAVEFTEKSCNDADAFQHGRAVFAAFEEAADMPLTRLLFLLAKPPLGIGNGTCAAQKDPEYAEYLEEHEKRLSLWNQALGGEPFPCALPSEVICIAPRCYEEQAADVKAAWTSHSELQYSRFYYYNIYPNIARYVIVDRTQGGEQQNSRDELLFYTAVLALASNVIPQDALRPNRVFRLEINASQDAINRMLSSYDAKLKATLDSLQFRIAKMKQIEPECMSDEQIRTKLQTPASVPVCYGVGYNRTAMRADPRHIGMAYDCPESEDAAWWGEKARVDLSLRAFLKEPRKSLRRAVALLKQVNVIQPEQISQMDSFQIEDFEEYTEDEERDMVRDIPNDPSDTAAFEKKRDQIHEEILLENQTRMTKKSTIAIGVTAILLYSCGFFPFIFQHITTGTAISFSIVLCLSAVFAIAASGFLCLLALRSRLRALWRDYNDATQRIVQNTDKSMAQYAGYLSHVCNVMRGHSVLNRLNSSKDPAVIARTTLEKHEADIVCIRETIADLADQMSVPLRNASNQAEPFQYDFDRRVDYDYSFSWAADKEHTIPFLEAGNAVSMPLAYVNAIMVVREELYE